MSNILAWGELEGPMKSDFTANKGAFTEKYKINKMGVNFISEQQDNFRDHLAAEKISKESQIVDYLQNENQRLIRNKLFRNKMDLTSAKKFNSEYRDNAAKVQDLIKNKRDFLEEVTPAGVPSGLMKAHSVKKIVSAAQLKQEELEDTIRDVWKKYEVNLSLYLQ